MNAFSTPGTSRRKLLSRPGYFLAAMLHGDRVRAGAQEGRRVMPGREATARCYSPGCDRPRGTTALAAKPGKTARKGER
jgi:hypothetical protein